MTRNVVAVVVTYWPDAAGLDTLVRRVIPDVAQVVIVDNTPGGSPVLPMAGAELIVLGRNLGLAAAQNVGIRRAFELGSEFVLLLDQDSLPEPGMVPALLAAHDNLARRGVLVAAVGPRIVDGRTRAPQPVVQADPLRMRRVWFETGNEVLETEFIVASGSLIARSALEHVGLMDESLFMDQIDVEWELRARAQGRRLFAVGAAVLAHTLGEGDRRIWFLRSHPVPVHTPLRNYYLFRNSIDIFFRRPAPRVWRIDRFKALVIMGFGYVTQVAPRMQRLQMIARGLWHALIGRRGELRR